MSMVALHGEVLYVAPAPQQLEDGGPHTIDQLVEINLGSDHYPHQTFVSTTLMHAEHEDYRTLLIQYRVVLHDITKTCPN
jgi:hypothetical protein